MAWRSQTQAAELLGISERTLSRRISTGTLETRRDGRHVLVNVTEDQIAQQPMAEMSENGGEMANVATPTAIERGYPRDAAADYRRISDSQVRQAQTVAKRAWLLAFAAWLTVLALIVGSGWLGWKFHSNTIEYERHVAELTTEKSVAQQRAASLASTLEGVRSELEQKRNGALSLATRLASLQTKHGRLQSALAQARSKSDRLAVELQRADSEHCVELDHILSAQDSLVSKNEQLLSQIDDYCTDLEDVESNNAYLANEVLELRCQTDLLTNSLNDANTRRDYGVAVEEEKIAVRDADLADSKQQLAVARRRAEVLAGVLNKTWSDLNQSQLRCEDLEDQLIQDRDANSQLRISLRAAEAKIARISDASKTLQGKIGGVNQGTAFQLDLRDHLSGWISSLAHSIRGLDRRGSDSPADRNP